MTIIANSLAEIFPWVTPEKPAAAERFREYESPKIKLLADLCRDLQSEVGDEPFPLSCRQAGKIIGVSTQDAGGYLFLLCHDGVIVKVRRGTAHTGPSLYRYLGE